MKLNLYIDFDGVILDTMDVAADIYFGGKEHPSKPPNEFYLTLDWKNLISKCHEINNSITNIAKLIDSNLFNVKILTHYVCDNEKQAKLEYLNNIYPDLEIITVLRNINKNEAVNAKGAILVDDYSENLELWSKSSGIPVKFSNKNKKYDYITINSLDSLIDIFSKLEALVKEKTC
ncbi:MAG: hypothetical protein VZS44_07075 [Bacilli bacterium]|nr:hypothetical protein [Bacilli bacterium]